MQTAKIFQNGGSQAVRLPKEFQLSGTEVGIQKIGDIVYLFPKEKAWEIFQQSLSKFSDDFMAEREQGEHQERPEL